MVTINEHYWQKFGFFSGHVFLDFINTYDDLGKSRELDALPDWMSVLEWAKKATVVNNHEYAFLQKMGHNQQAQTELKLLHTLRQTGWHIFGPLSENKQPDHAALTKLSQQIQFSYCNSTLNYLNGEFNWTANTATKSADLIRIRLGLAAAELLDDTPLPRLSQCSSCTGLFINHGRGVGRKWCRMSSCGNRAKIRKFRSST